MSLEPHLIKALELYKISKDYYKTWCYGYNDECLFYNKYLFCNNSKCFYKTRIFLKKNMCCVYKWYKHISQSCIYIYTQTDIDVNFEI